MNSYIICIGKEGLEIFLDISDYPEEDERVMMDKLKSPDGENVKPNKYHFTLNAIGMRIRLNEQRDIKSFLLTTDVDAKTMENIVFNKPSALAKMLQTSGKQIQL
jgi:hypothetical protein